MLKWRGGGVYWFDTSRKPCPRGGRVPDLRFNSSVPVEVQLTPFSCSVGATFWCLRSLGLSLSQQDLENVMVPALVSPDKGLLDGSGATIVSLLRQTYGLSVSNASQVGFDDVVARAGKAPIALGGSRWYVEDDGSVTGHWVAVRGYENDQLLLANPGGTGPHFGQQSLTRDDFAQRAPFAAVWFDGAVVAATFVPNQMISGTDGAGVNVRSQPTTDASIVSAFRDGTLIHAGDHRWRSVTDPTGAQGWVADDYLDSVDGGFQVVRTDGTGANLRSQPGTDAAPIKLLPEGTTLTGADHAWCQVSDASGTSGWVAAEFVYPPRAD
jgi:SH3-like domain-containing protein